MIYLLDTNVLIEASRRYYAFDLCPGFWRWVTGAMSNGTVRSVDAVRAELEAKDDELSAWVKDGATDLFLSPTQASMVGMARVMGTVTPKYEKPSVDAFARKADAVLIAHALAHQYTVVTEEGSAPHSTKKIKIPDVCRLLGVACVDTFSLLRSQRAAFELNVE